MFRYPRAGRSEASTGSVEEAGSDTHSSQPTSDRADGPGRLRLLASAIVGRSVDVVGLDAGEASWTDGATVFVDEAGPLDRQLASVVVQSSLLGAGSLAPDVLDALRRRPHLVGRYLAIEGHRALSAHESLLPTQLCRLIDCSVASRTQSALESLEIASGREEIAEPPDVFGTIHPKRVQGRDERREARGETPQHVARGDGQAQLRELAGGDEGEGPDLDLFSSPVGGGGGIGRLFKKLLGEGRSADGGAPGTDSATRWSSRATRVSGTFALSTSNGPVPGHLAAIEARGTVYPEWDRRNRRYKRDWCTVSEVEQADSELLPFAMPDVHGLRQPLARLGIDLERHHRQLQGDDVDVDAVVEARVALKARSAPEEAVYIDTVRRRRDLSVLLLLDVSGSAGEPSATGVPVHEHQRAAAAALAVTLHELGDRVGLYGFRSQGRSAVHLVPVKRFGDDLDALVMQRLGGLVPAAYTRLGAAIRHGAAILEHDAGTPRQLLVVLSDGFAYDHGYERAYGEADARQALIETRRRGIGSLCLSIGAGTDTEALRRVFGTTAHAALTRVEQLPEVVGPLFRSALRAAELQRRASQRRRRTRERLDIEKRSA